MKLTVVLLSSDTLTSYGTAEIEAGEFFKLDGSVIWESRYFKAQPFNSGTADPFPMIEQPPKPIMLAPGSVKPA